MCGIVGYIGDKKKSVNVLINALTRLEYRGYDSAGIAILNDRNLFLEKEQGKLSQLKNNLKKQSLQGQIGIGHTRWATHGIPNKINAHPHIDVNKQFAIVHNGIIENYQEIKQKLTKKGYKFLSDTDSEIIANLISKNYNNDLLQAVFDSIKQLEGSFALVVMSCLEPNRLIAVRKDSPLIVGLGKNENFLASDMPAIIEYTKKIIYLENNEIVDLRKNQCDIYNNKGKKQQRKFLNIKWDIKQAQKDGYKHFMFKEIMEQPNVLNNIFVERIKNNKVVFKELSITKIQLKTITRIVIVACGTAYHAGLTSKYILEKYTKIPVEVDTSSEFRYRDPLLNKKTLVIVISQSGETADTLAALREAKKKKSIVLSICNVMASSIARESDGVIYTRAGSEIAVASTKAYTAQLAVLYLFTYYLGQIKNTIKENNFLKEIKKIPKHVEKFLSKELKQKKISKYATDFHEYYLASNHKSCFLYLARNINYPNAIEGALKLKEISYISAEGYPAGEMKHGPIALIDENPWVVCIAVQSNTYDKMLSNIQEIRSRGGIIIAIITENDKKFNNKEIKYIIEVPKVSEIFSPFLVVLPLQLLAYYVAEDFGYDIDQPRNLAKSVTVE